MKKVLALVAAAGILSVASLASAATIVGSKHDMNAAWAGGVLSAGATAASGTTQVCVYCHAPHGSQAALPLWNRNNPTGFTLYSGLNMANVSFKTGFTADSTSLFCMSCHDGAMNINAVYNQGANIRNSGATLVTGTIGATSKANLGKNLATTHPVNFPVLNNSQADLNYVASNTYMGPIAAQAVTAGAPNITTTFPLFKATRSGVATSQSLECGSCHSVHDFTISPFLRATMDKSALCLGCHNK